MTKKDLTKMSYNELKDELRRLGKELKKYEGRTGGTPICVAMHKVRVEMNARWEKVEPAIWNGKVKVTY